MIVYDGADADVGAFPDRDAATEVCAGPDRAERFEADVMSNERSAIDDHVLIQHRILRDDDTGIDHTAGSDLGAPGDDGGRMDDRGQGIATSDHSGDEGTAPGADDACHH